MVTTDGGFDYIELAPTYSPGTTIPVPSALAVLTTLFGKVRGEPRRKRHQHVFKKRTRAVSDIFFEDKDNGEKQMK